MTNYETVEKYFPENVKNHTMEILHNDDFYRHLRFSNDGSSVYYFDIITWPGSLCISGDMGTFTFSRVKDMFMFFRGESINPGYWAEKLTAVCKTDGHREYNSELVIKQVKEHYDYFCENQNLNEEQKNNLWEEIEYDVLPNLEYESSAYDALRNFRHDDFEFIDAWEWEFTQFTYRYLWNITAIVYAIKTFDAKMLSNSSNHTLKVVDKYTKTRDTNPIVLTGVNPFWINKIIEKVKKMKKFLGLSWLGWLNFLVVQWFCVRIARQYDAETNTAIGWGLVYFVLPLTGWWSSYKFLWEKK
jgi:hypothetical protein